MKPHLTDHPRAPTPDRAAQYLAIARTKTPNHATLALQSRPQAQADTGRVAQFLRIARGKTA